VVLAVHAGQLNFNSNCSGAENLTSCILATPEKEGDWFDLSGFERTTSWHQRLTQREPPELSLMAKLAAPGGTVGAALGYMAPPYSGFETHAPGQGHPTPWWTWPMQTLWNRQRVSEGDRALFVSVFVPYDRKSTTGRKTYEGVVVQLAADNESAVVEVKSAGKRVHLDVRGGWAVDTLPAMKSDDTD
jgi:hypothetical protein